MSTNTTPTFPLIVRDSRLKEVVGISPTQARRLLADPNSGFPRRKQFGSPRVCGFDGRELETWVRERGRVIK